MVYALELRPVILGNVAVPEIVLGLLAVKAILPGVELEGSLEVIDEQLITLKL
jgi:hypothetical protein